MEEKDNVKKSKTAFCRTSGSSGDCGGAVYGLGIIGAAFYYISTAPGFWAGALGLLKSIVWPAFLVY